MKRVLFLCTSNSARSQIAEAIANAQMGEQWQAVSAGTQPTGYVHSNAIRALAEMGIDISDARSKSAEEYRSATFDLVVTVCDDAAENCPVWLGQGKCIHLGFPDPAKATGTDEQVMAVFRKVRDDIVVQVPVLLQEHSRE